VAVRRIKRRSSRRFGAPRSQNGKRPHDGELRGRARLGKRTKRLTKRLGAADVAVIDHEDIDRVSGEDLVATGVGCVVNVARSTSGRYPNQGPLILTHAGVCLVDVPGADLFDRLDDGDEIVVRGGQVLRDGEVIAEGEQQTVEIVERDREWNDGAARTRFLQLLEAAGYEDPWGRAQRRRLSALLFT